MPSGLIDEEDGVGPWCDCLGDFGQMQVHRFGVAGREDQSRALSLLRADGSEDVGRGGALIPRSVWASTALGPPAGDLVLLTNARASSANQISISLTSTAFSRATSSRRAGNFF